MNKDLKLNIFGSSDSQDVDVLVLLDEIILPLKHHQCVNMCKSYTKMVAEQLGLDENNVDVNLCKVENGVMVWCAKGYADETNNALLATYNDHKQTHPCFVTQKLPRLVDYKIHRAIRCFLGSLTRSQYRDLVKSALNPKQTLNERMLCAQIIDMSQLEWSRTINVADKLKRSVVQLLQCISLIDGQELYTKQELRQYYPNMTHFINRDTPTTEDYNNLQLLINIFADKIRLKRPDLLNKCELSQID